MILGWRAAPACSARVKMSLPLQKLQAGEVQSRPTDQHGRDAVPFPVDGAVKAHEFRRGDFTIQAVMNPAPPLNQANPGPKCLKIHPTSSDPDNADRLEDRKDRSARFRFDPSLRAGVALGMFNSIKQ